MDQGASDQASQTLLYHLWVYVPAVCQSAGLLQVRRPLVFTCLPRCRQQVYCSVACQRRHWSRHSHQCSLLSLHWGTEALGEQSLQDEEQLRVLAEVLKLSLLLVEEAESQLYEDQDGQDWLVLEDYKLPPSSRPVVKMNLPMEVPQPYLFTAPEDFKPRRTSCRTPFQYINGWGLPEEFENDEFGSEEDLMTHMKMMMVRHNMGILGGDECPEIQYVDKLIELKARKLAGSWLNRDTSPDLVLKIELPGTEPRISGGNIRGPNPHFSRWPNRNFTKSKKCTAAAASYPNSRRRKNNPKLTHLINKASCLTHFTF